MHSILLVEDELPLRQCLHDILEDEGYQVLDAANGLAALQVLDTTRPSLIVTDVMMPGMDGIALCEQIQAHPDTAQIPIIVCSAGQLRPARDRCRYVAFVEKPFVLTVLLDTIGAALRATGPDTALA